jgi:Cupin-like domain
MEFKTILTDIVNKISFLDFLLIGGTLIGAYFIFYPAIFLTHFYFGSNFVDKSEEKFTENISENAVDSGFSKVSKFLQNIYSALHPKQRTNHPKLKVMTADALQDFKAFSKGLSVPVLIRGGLKNSPACRKWSFDYFMKGYADKKIVCINDSSVQNSNRSIKEGALLDGSVKTLRAVIENIEQGGSNYVSNVSEFLQANPELVEELEIVSLIKDIKKESKFSRFNYLFSQIFMGNSHSVSALHCAIGTNLFVNVFGRKTWYLIPPKYTSLLKPHLNQYGLFAISEQDIFNPNDISQKIPYISVTLDPGDVLFIPPWWWHAVRNESELTIGVANRIDIEHRAYLSSNRLFTFLHVRHGLSWSEDTPDEDILKTYVSVKSPE